MCGTLWTAADVIVKDLSAPIDAFVTHSQGQLAAATKFEGHRARSRADS